LYSLVLPRPEARADRGQIETNEERLETLHR
jgi:hypothetical protein